MSDNGTRHTGDHSPEHIAYKLMLDIAHAEDVRLFPHNSSGDQRIDRDWILSTYAECLRTVRSASYRKGS